MGKEKEELISVIIPVYNTAEYIERCIWSILNSTYTNLEIICIDDGSTDNSLELLNSLQEKDKRIIVIKKNNAGVSAARNDGLKIAHGEYVAFVDSDDWIHREFFSYLMKMKKDADVIVANFKETSEIQINDKNDLPKVEGELLDIDEAFWNNQVRKYVCGRIYRRKCLNNYFQEGIRLGEDTMFNVLLLSNEEVVNIRICKEELYYYFNRKNSAVHRIEINDYLKLGEWYLENIASLKRKDFALYECFRVFFLYRYVGSLKGKLEVKKMSGKYLKECLKLLNNEQISLKKKVKYYVATIFPQLYRLNLIAKDRTMLQWERSIKNSDT